MDRDLAEVSEAVCRCYVVNIRGTGHLQQFALSPNALTCPASFIISGAERKEPAFSENILLARQLTCESLSVVHCAYIEKAQRGQLNPRTQKILASQGLGPNLVSFRCSLEPLAVFHKVQSWGPSLPLTSRV